MYSYAKTSELEYKLKETVGKFGYGITEIKDYSSNKVFKDGKFIPIRSGLEYHVKSLTDADEKMRIQMLFPLVFPLKINESTNMAAYDENFTAFIDVEDNKEENAEKLARLLDGILSELQIGHTIVH